MNRKEYWDEFWADRIGNKNEVYLNQKKLKFLTNKLIGKPELTSLNKLDIGCGTGIQALVVDSKVEHWADTWTGIDESLSATRWGRNKGLNCLTGNFLDFTFHKKFDVFFFFDVLEHVYDHEAIARKLLEVARDSYLIIGNIPLFVNKELEHKGVERLLDVDDLNLFLDNCNCPKLRHFVYGINGFPFMYFEAIGEKNETK